MQLLVFHVALGKALPTFYFALDRVPRSVTHSTFSPLPTVSLYHRSERASERARPMFETLQPHHIRPKRNELWNARLSRAAHKHKMHKMTPTKLSSTESSGNERSNQTRTCTPVRASTFQRTVRLRFPHGVHSDMNRQTFTPAHSRSPIHGTEILGRPRATMPQLLCSTQRPVRISQQRPG